MRLFLACSDEPLYLVPYIKRIVTECNATVVGVAVHSPVGQRVSMRRLASTLLLGLVMTTPAQWLRLLGWKVRDVLAGLGVARTTHHLADVCREAGIPCTRIESVNAESFISLLREQRVDVLLHQTPEILRGGVLNAPAIGVLNRHLSLLPAYRGAWPLFWQLANGDREVGISLHLVDDGIDSGAVIVQEPLVRRDGESPAALMARLFDRSVPLTCAALKRLSGGQRASSPAAGGRVYKTPRPMEVLAFMFKRRSVRAS